MNVDPSRRKAWFGAALLVGVAYLVIGRVFVLPSGHVRAWRLAAWVVSGGAYSAHVLYEHFRLRSSPRVTAWHAAVAVAIGAIALAVAGMAHALSIGSGIGPRWLLALVIWPAVTAVPAFLGALAAATVLTRLRRSSSSEP